MSIPKIIHYCWLSEEEYPVKIRDCIDSWNRLLPDYQIKLWDRNSIDFDKWPYAKEALTLKKYAFASDIIRLIAIYSEGGIYLDSDIEVLKSFDSLLSDKAFIGFESGFRVGPWLIAGEKGNPIIKEMLDYYVGKHFCDKNGNIDMTPNTVPITRILSEHGLKPVNDIQRLDNITIYPEEFYCPMNPWTGKINKTENTYAMHLFAGAWNDNASDEMLFIDKINDNISDFLIWRNKNHITAPVIIFGTGVVGLRCLECLTQAGERNIVKCFVVTRRDNSWKEISGIKIKEICECLNEDKEFIILVGTNPRSHDSICRSLNDNGFKNIFCLGRGHMSNFFTS